MAYLESGSGCSAFRMGQRGGSTGNHVLDTVNLYHGAVAFPLSLVSLSGRDGLSVSVQASYQGGQLFQGKMNNRSEVSSVLGYGWKMPIARIVAGNRAVRESYQSDFYLTGEGGEYPLYRKGRTDGAVEFISVEHPLWQFLFYEGIGGGLSCWKIRKEDGSTWVYGGTEDSIETALCWDNWAGAAVNNGGEPWVAGWCLSKVESYNKSCLLYRYENVREPLGDAVYTRTIRLAEVISGYGERAEFCYRPKETEEYEPGHRPAGGQNAFQCQWEDCYLDEITVKGITGTVQYTQKLGYELRSLAGETGDRKRLLVSVTQTGADGMEQSPLRLFYGDGEDGSLSGVLSRVAYPLGESVCYDYEEQEFPSGSGSLKLTPPGSDWETRLIHGEDFTVLLYRREEYVKLQVLFWDMGWHLYEPECFAGGIFPQMRVLTGQGFFAAVFYDAGQASYIVRLVKRNPVRRFEWDVEEHLLPMETEEPAIACGADYFAVQYRRQALLEIAQFDYMDNGWHWQAFPQEPYDFAALGGGRGCLFGAFYEKGDNQLLLRSFYADESHVWKEGESHARGMKAELALSQKEAVWSVGQGQAAAVFLSAETSRFHAELILLRWRTDFSFADVASFEVYQEPDVKNPILYAVSTDTVIGFAHTALRYTPGSWNPCTLLEPAAGGEYRYAYGSDLALAAERRDGRQRFVGMRFDPYRQGWTADGAPASEEMTDNGFLCVPLVFGDFAVLGNKLFVRGSDEGWKAVWQFPEDADLSSLQAAPDASCLLYGNGAGDETVLLSLYNQRPQETCRFRGQACTLDYSVMVRANAFFTYIQPSSSREESLCPHYLGADRQYHDFQKAQVVSRAVLDTGFGRQEYRFGYAADSARLESGMPAFAAVRVYPEGDGKSFGYTEHRFYNGLSPDSPYAEYQEEPFTNVKDFYSHMAGRLFQSVTYDGEGQPVTGSYTRLYAMDGHGYCIRETKTVKQTWLDPYDTVKNQACGGERTAVETVIETEYEPRFYQARKMTEYGTGNIRISQSQTYAWEIYPQLLEAHLYDAVAMSRKTEEPGNGQGNGTGEGAEAAGKVLEATGVLWEENEDGIWREASNWRFDGNGEAAFRFRPGQAGWFMENCVVRRGKKGEVTESADSDGLHDYYGYDKDSRFVVSRFSGAAGMQPFYFGFEPYEELGAWKGGGTGAELLLTEKECFSGSRCLELRPGMWAEIRTPISRFDMPLLLSLSMKTAELQEAAGTAELFFVSGRKTEKMSYALAATGGVWQKQEISFRPPEWEKDGSGTVTLRLTAPAAGSMRIDTVALTLTGCPGTLSVYDPDTMLQLAEHPTVGNGQILQYDARLRPAAAASDDGVFRSCTRYAEGYRQNRPDEVMAVEMPQGGLLANFRRGRDFLRHWQAEGSWETEGGKLCLTLGKGQSGTLVWKEPPGNAFLLYLQWGDVCREFSLCLDSVKISCRNDVWSLLDGDRKYEGGRKALTAGANCHLLFVGGRLGLWAEGSEIFARKVEPQELKNLKLYFASSCSLSALGFCRNPKVQITYQDYIGRALQDQAVTEKGVMTAQTLYDELGQASVKTKQAEAEGALWAYREDFVKSFDWESGIMEGEVADAYAEDAGYPYTRMVWLQCAEPRVRAFGQPGADFAIRGDSAETAPAVKNQCIDTERFAGCRIETVREPDRKVTATVYDWMDNRIAVTETGPDGRTCSTRYEYDSRGNLLRVRLPGTEEDGNDVFAIEASYDFLGNQTEKATPDSGTSYTAYDRLGRLRFSQSAGNREDGCIVYHLYDWMGRETEVGVYAGVWDGKAMQELAWKPCAGAPAGAVWKRRMEYDGDGSNPLLLGRLWRCRSVQDGVTVTETFSYDRQGNIVCHEQETDGHRESVWMEYDETGNLVRRRLSSAGGQEISYCYDLQGRMVSVNYGNQCLCRYEYRPEGGLGKEIFAPDGPGRLEREYTYNSCHWLTEIKDPYFRQTLSYQAAGGEDGRITEETSVFLQPSVLPAEIAKEVRYSYAYDGLGRLSRAAVQMSDLGQEPAESGRQAWEYAYDGNGNALRINDDELLYGAGTNRLLLLRDRKYDYAPDGMVAEISGSGQRGLPQNGEVIPQAWEALPQDEAGGWLRLRYDSVFQTLTELETAGGKMRYFYNASNGAAACEDGSGRTYFLLDGEGRILSRMEPDGTVCICVRGVNGIFAQIRNGTVYYLLKDQRDSVRAVYDGERLCAAYHYLPFGGYLGKVWEEAGAAACLPLRFAGHILEPCGLYRLRARWYDPLSGRFLSIDPESQFASPYLYGASDWINYLDPDGAYSGWSALAGVAGFLLVVAGAALSICTAGMASPVGALVATLGASALIGAGMGTTIYAITSSITGDFNWKDCLINAGAGAVFGMIGAGAGAAFPAGFTIGSCSAAVSSYIVDIGVGVVVGAADSVITNGCLNVVHGKNFADNIGTNLWVGALTGGIMSGIGGLGHGLRNARAMGAGGARTEAIGVGRNHIGQKISHASVWKEYPGTGRYGRPVNLRRGTDHVPSEVGDKSVKRLLDNQYFNDNIQAYRRIEVSNNMYRRMVLPRRTRTSRRQDFNIITNNCTTYAVDMLARTGISSPIWVRSPSILMMWTKWFTAWQ